MKSYFATRRKARRLANVVVTWAKDALPPGVQQRVPARLRAMARRWTRTNRSKVEALDEKLWGGFSESARADLQALFDDANNSPSRRYEAAFSLARWQASQNDFASALDYLRRGGEIALWKTRFKRHYLLEAQFLCYVGQPEAARTLIEERKQGFDPNTELLLASTWSSTFAAPGPEADRNCLAHVNAVFAHFGLAKVQKIDGSLPLSIDNIVGVDVPPSGDPEKSVTIIVPAFNAADTIETALRSIAQQSWRNLKVLVVDDCSTDDTVEHVVRFCNSDDRFQLIRKTENSGSYASRNLALGHVTTPFVTIHDGDDWSHPQKLERQMVAFAGSKAPYNYTMWARVTPELGFVGNPKPFYRLLGPDHSSGLFRTADVLRAGGWDQARISADTELFWRLEAFAGGTREHSRSRRVLVECPLAFGRFLKSSLTQVGATHALTMFHGVRREYREAAEHWHRSLTSTEGLQGPFFPAPSLIRPKVDADISYDVLVIGDLNGTEAEAKNTVLSALAAAKAGFTTALFNYPAYWRNTAKPLSAQIRQLAWENQIRIVAPGEHLRVNCAVMTDLGLLQHRLDRFPTLEVDRAVVLVNRSPAGTETPEHLFFDPVTANSNAISYFGSHVELIATSPLATSIWTQHPEFGASQVTAWPTIVEPDEITRPEAAHARRRAPLLGKYGIDGASDWPLDIEETLKAYCAETPSALAVFGDITTIKSRLGRLPRNWRDGSYASASEFFADIDILLYYPADAHNDPSGYPALLAMAAGVPVVTRPEYEMNFGSAAAYAAPDQVWETVERLWRQQPDLRHLSVAGRAYVEANHSFNALVSRLQRLQQQDGGKN